MKAFLRKNKKLMMTLAGIALSNLALGFYFLISPTHSDQIEASSTSDASFNITDSVGWNDSGGSDYVYVVGDGTDTSTSANNKNTDSTTWTGPGNEEVFVSKYDHTGTRVAAIMFPVSGADVNGGEHVAIGSDGSVYVTGTAHISSSGLFKVFVAKLPNNLASTSLTVTTYSGSSSLDKAAAIATYTTGGTERVYVAATLLNSGGYSDMSVLQYPTSLSGSPVEGRLSASSTYYSAAKMFVNSEGVYVAGNKGINISAAMFPFAMSTTPTSPTYTYAAWDYQGDATGSNTVTGITTAVGSTHDVYVGGYSSLSSGGTEMILLGYAKTAGTLNHSGDFTTSSWHPSLCTLPATTSVGVQLDPATGDPVEVGNIAPSPASGFPSDILAVHWTTACVMSTWGAYDGEKYDNDLALDFKIDSSSSVHIMGTKSRPTYVILGTAPEYPCGYHGLRTGTTDSVGAMQVEQQAFLIDVPVGNIGTMSFSQDHSGSTDIWSYEGFMALTALHRFSSFARENVPDDDSRYVDNYYY